MARSGWIALLAPLALLCASTAGAQDDARYMVKFKDFRGAAQAVAAAGGRVALELEPQGVIAAYLPEQALQGLRNNPNVEYVEVDPRRYPMAQTTPYGIKMVQADDSAFGNSVQSGVMVCIIDSGYQLAHEDLPGDKQNPQSTSDGISGTNDSGTGNWYEDSCGHGTHVAGTIAALNNNVGVVGVNGRGSLNLHVEKVFSGSTCAWAYSSTLITALNRCQTAANGGGKKLVVSMSLGGSLSSRTEDTAFQQAYNNGVLSVAAAGNDGSTRKSYPASYASVISVAAVDSAGVVASFSQKNDAVELAAPGVGVVSTTPFKPSSLTASGTTWFGTNIDGSARTPATGVLANGGRCASAGAWDGKVVLCERGDIAFADKVANVRAGGGTGAVIYNNVSGGFAGTLNGTSTIPAISISQEDGVAAVAAAGSGNTTGALDNTAGYGNGYEAYDGTSMATPHVSGVAALLWSFDVNKSNAQIRDALQKTAEDKGAAGRDTSYGYGIVKAADALAYLTGGGGGGGQTGITLSVKKVKSAGKSYADLTWSGSSSADVYRNSTAVATKLTNSTYRDGPLVKGSYTYKVCNSGSTTTCSSNVTVTF